MTQTKTVVQVTIGDEEFTVRSDRPEEHTRAVAEHVDRTVKEIRAAGSIVESHKVAVLAALAITDELFQERKATRDLADRLSALARDLSRVLPPKKRPQRPAEPFASSERGA